MVPRKHSAQAEFLPHLAETRVDIQKRAVRSPIQDLSVSYESHDVQKQGRAGNPFQNLLAWHADRLPFGFAKQRERSSQVELFHDPDEGAQVHGLVNGTALAPSVHAHLRLQSGQKHNIPTELAEPEEVLQKDPRLAAVPGIVAYSAADDAGADHLHLF